MAVAWGVDWSQLRHSAGEASNLPEMLERLTSSDADAVADAVLELAAYVTRSIDSAAPAVVRVVLDVLARPDAVARDYLLSLVAGTCGAVHAKYLVDLKRIRSEAVGEDQRPMRPWEETVAATEEEKPWMLASCAAAAERLPFLLTLTRDPDPEVRLEVGGLLALLDPVADRVLPALRDAAAAETDERVRAGFVVAVSVASARSGQDRNGVAAWIRQLAHDTALPDSVRAAAAVALHPVDGGVLTEDDTAALRAALTEQSVAVLTATPWLGYADLDWEQLPQRLFDLFRVPGAAGMVLDDLVISYATDPDPTLRAAVADAAQDLAEYIGTGRPAMLGNPGPLSLSGNTNQVARVWRLVETMAGLLGDADPEVRERAASNLASIGEAVRWVVEPLVAALGDEDRIRAMAVVALARAGDQRAVEPVRDLLGQQECWLIDGYGVLRGLRPFAGALIAAIARNLTDHESQPWRGAQEGMIQALSLWGRDAAGAAAALTRRVGMDRSYYEDNMVWTHRSTDVRALGSIGPAAAGALPVLTELASDADEPDAPIAAWACWRISGDPELAIRRLGERPDLDLVADLGPNGAGLVPTVEPLLADDDQSVRIAAARALWRLTGDAARSVEVLTREAATLGRPEGLPHVVPQAFAHLAEIGAPARSALPVIETILADPKRLRRAESPEIVKDAYDTLLNS